MDGGRSAGQGRGARAAAQTGQCRRWRASARRKKQRAVWHVRESALGAMVFVPGEPDRWEGWEDAAVPPAQLGDYLRAITKLMAEYGYRSPLYGHYGQGCVHTRINFDFSSVEGQRNSASLLSAPRMWCSSLADRSAASMAMGNRGRRCCPRCLGRS